MSPPSRLKLLSGFRSGLADDEAAAADAGIEALVDAGQAVGPGHVDEGREVAGELVGDGQEAGRLVVFGQDRVSDLSPRGRAFIRSRS